MYHCSNTREESHRTISNSNLTICSSARSSDSEMRHKLQTTTCLLETCMAGYQTSTPSVVPTEICPQSIEKSSSHGRTSVSGSLWTKTCLLIPVNCCLQIPIQYRAHSRLHIKLHSLPNDPEAHQYYWNTILLFAQLNISTTAGWIGMNLF